MKTIRLDNYLTKTMGISRSEAKQYIKKGRVTVDGEPAARPERKVEAESAQVCVDGHPCTYEEYSYLMLHKPAGVVSATEDAVQRTVLDLLGPEGNNLFPVGRLDKDTEGLLLLTNDGALAHALLSPGKHVEKCYYALLDGPVGEEEQRQFAAGLDIGEKKPALPAKLEPAGGEEPFAVHITICEGKFHQVKRMAQAVGRKVLYLKRLSMGSLRLDETLLPGQYRRLTEEEVDALRKAAPL